MCNKWERSSLIGGVRSGEGPPLKNTNYRESYKSTEVIFKAAVKLVDIF